MQFCKLLFCFALVFSMSASAQQQQGGVNVTISEQGYKDSQFCADLNAKRDALDEALRKSKISSSNFSKMISTVDQCQDEDEEFDPEDDGFSCTIAESNCKALLGANAKDLKDDYKDSEDRVKDSESRLKDARKDADQLAKDLADFQKDSAEAKNEILADMKEEEKTFNEQVRAQKKDFLSNMNGINDQISKLQSNNRKIIQDAKAAMAGMELAKKKARLDCREAARTDYKERLKQLDIEVGRRGGKVGGGFEGIQNLEKYRNFLVSKIQKPEPSEFFNLCLSEGDKVDTLLTENKVGTALNMDNFTVQMDENLKAVEELKRQIEREQKLANEEQQQMYKAHYEKMMLLNQKLNDHYTATREKAVAMQREQQNARLEVEKAQRAEWKSTAARDNSERRYNCAKNNGGRSSSSGEDIAGAYATVKAKAAQVQFACCDSGESVPSTCRAACGSAGSCSGGSSGTGGSNGSGSRR